jgi:hypothetical protein
MLHGRLNMIYDWWLFHDRVFQIVYVNVTWKVKYDLWLVALS